MVSEIEELRKDTTKELYKIRKLLEKIVGYAELKTELETKLINMNAVKKNNPTIRTQEELLTEIIHRLKHLEKGQQAIKAHLWSTKGERITKEDGRELIRSEAVNYINSVVMPEIEAAQAEQGEISTQGLTDWIVATIARPVAEYLKTQVLTYIGEALAELKRKAIPYAIQAADWIIDKLEDIVVKQYQQADATQQEQFKANIEEHFPNSRLLGKL